MLNISRSLLDRIAKEYGPSFYLLDTEKFKRNFEKLLGEFRLHYPKTNIAYSYKTNYIPRFCRIVDELGGYAEVVSDMEYRIARKVGVLPTNIFYNGPYKDALAIEELLLGGGTVNADSLVDLDQIIDCAKKNPAKKVEIGLRCNFNVNDGVLSRFGFDVNGKDFQIAKARISSVSNVSIAGLHCHFAARNIETWVNRTQGMLEVIEDHLRNSDAPLKFISLGGGMYGEMPEILRRQFSVPIPTFADYALAAAKPFAEFFKKRNDCESPELLIEPGTALAADSVKFAATVVGVKEIQGKIIATLAGSIYNINPTPNRKNLPIHIYPDSDSSVVRNSYENVDFGGFTCIESDYLYKNYSGEIAAGDYVVFDDVGAYSVVMKPPFILPNFAVVEWNSSSDIVSLVKRREVFDDLFHTYAF